MCFANFSVFGLFENIVTWQASSSLSPPRFVFKNFATLKFETQAFEPLFNVGRNPILDRQIEGLTSKFSSLSLASIKLLLLQTLFFALFNISLLSFPYEIHFLFLLSLSPNGWGKEMEKKESRPVYLFILLSFGCFNIVFSSLALYAFLYRQIHSFFFGEETTKKR